MSLPTSSTSRGKAWFILHFEDPSIPMAHDILYLNNPAESLSSASNALENTIHSRFDRLGDMENGDAFRICRLAVTRPDTSDLQITLMQLVTFLRDLPPGSPVATTPDLWGLGGNWIQVTFEYVEVFY